MARTKQTSRQNPASKKTSKEKEEVSLHVAGADGSAQCDGYWRLCVSRMHEGNFKSLALTKLPPNLFFVT